MHPKRAAVRTVHALAAVTVAIALVLASAGPLPAPAHAQGSPSATIDRVRYEFEQTGIRFYVDVTVDGERDQDVLVGVWFLYDDSEEYAYNAGPDDEYESQSGSLVTSTLVRPCCDNTVYRREDGSSIDLFIPYNAFPSATYDWAYVPMVAVQSKGSGDFLATEALWDEPITVVGSGDPLGHVVWLSVRSMQVVEMQESGLFDSPDEIMLLYTLNEVTPDGYLRAYDMHAWGVYDMTEGETYDADYFPWLQIDAWSGSSVWASLVLTEVDNYEAAQEYIGLVNATVGGVGLVTFPFALNPAVAAGIGIAAFISGVADITINVIALLDTDDVFGDMAQEFTPDRVRALGASGETWDNTYRLTGDDYDYRVTVSVFVQPYYQHRPSD